MSSMVRLNEGSPPTANPPLANISGQFMVNNWNPFVPMDRYVDFVGSTAPSSFNSVLQEKPGMSSTNACPMEQITRLPFLNGGKITGPLGFSEDGQTAGPLLPTGFLSSNGLGVGKDSKGKKKRRMAECGAFDLRSPFDRIPVAEAERKKDVSPDSVKCPRGKDEKGERGQQIPAGNAQKLTSLQAKENSPSGDAPKEDYIHVRAKRGQATNSHSLAERVRREKISQRMKFLQDLVPGCSKITGKAVMLDEIINYVQSLQQQVEFLSMKLATVNPELNFDIQQLLSTDPLHLQTRSSAVPRFGPGFGAPHLHFQGPIQRVMQEDMSPNAWDDELQNVVQMDFIPSTHIDANTESPGSMKMVP